MQLIINMLIIKSLSNRTSRYKDGVSAAASSKDNGTGKQALAWNWSTYRLIDSFKHIESVCLKVLNKELIDEDYRDKKTRPS